MVKELLHFLESAIKNNKFKIRGHILKYYLKLHGCEVGKRLRCHNFPRFRLIPHNNFKIGDNVTIGYDITFEITKNAKLIIGNNVKITQNVILSSGKEIFIGDDTLIAENTSIRDGDHNVFNGELITHQPSIYKPIYIGSDVWIGAGCLILKGSILPKGVVIAANSVVIEKTKMEENWIYGGSPVKEIKQRPTRI